MSCLQQCFLSGQVGATNNRSLTGCSSSFCQMVQPSQDMYQFPENLIYFSDCTCAEGWRACGSGTRECKGACDWRFTHWPVLCTCMRSKKANEAHSLAYRYKLVTGLICHSHVMRKVLSSGTWIKCENDIVFHFSSWIECENVSVFSSCVFNNNTAKTLAWLCRDLGKSNPNIYTIIQTVFPAVNTYACLFFIITLSEII